MIKRIALGFILAVSISACLTTSIEDIHLYEDFTGDKTIITRFWYGGILVGGTCFFYFGYKVTPQSYYLRVSVNIDDIAWKDEFGPYSPTSNLSQNPVKEMVVYIDDNVHELLPVAQSVKVMPSGRNVSISLAFPINRVFIERLVNASKVVFVFKEPRKDRKHELLKIHQAQIQEFIDYIDQREFELDTPIRVP